MSDEFSLEQSVAIEVMSVAGVKDPEAVARADRLAAYSVGAHLEPVLRRLCATLADAVETVRRIGAS